MRGAGRFAGGIDPHEGLLAGCGKTRYAGRIVVREQAEIQAGFVDGPRLDAGLAVGGGQVAGEVEAGVFVGRDGGVIPPVIAMADRPWITERDVLLDEKGSRAKDDFDQPAHAVHQIRVAYEDGGAAVGILAGGEIDRRDGGPTMADGEVEFGAGGGPGSAQADGAFLDDGVGVKEVMAVEFVGAAVDASAEIGEDGAAEVFVFEFQGAPSLLGQLGGVAVAGGVGVIAGSIGGEEREGRVGIGRGFVVGGQRQGVGPDSDGARDLGHGGQAQDKSEGPDASFTMGMKHAG